MKTHLASALFIAAVVGFNSYVPLIASYDQHDQHVIPVNQPAPRYPFDLRKAEIEGAVLVSFIVTAQGDVTDAVVVKSTDRVFEEPTLMATKLWKFRPAIIEGKVCAVPALQLITFRVPGKKLETPTLMLIGKMKQRVPITDPALNLYTSTSKCFCGTGKDFNDCHFRSLQASN